MLTLPQRSLPLHHNWFFPHLKRSKPVPSSPFPPGSPTLLDLDDDTLQTIFEKLLYLVPVSNNKRISESALALALPLASTCTRLMNIFSRSLTDLELWTTANITDAGLSFLCTRGTTHIRRLVLRGCNRLHSSFSYIVQCQAIRTLDLSYIASVDDAILTRICTGIGSTLQSLLIRGCVSLTDHAIHAVAEECINLRALDLGGLIQLTDSSVEHLVKLRRDTLQVLVLSWCRSITDTSLHMLANTNLQAVFLRGLSITDAGVDAMIQGIGKQIVALDLLDCRNVTNSVFTGCLQTCPILRRNLKMADQRSIFQNGVSLLAGYVFVVAGVNEYGQESTVVCVVDAGSANSVSFHIMSGQAMKFDTDDIKVIATNSGVTLTRGTKEFLKHSFGTEL